MILSGYSCMFVPYNITGYWHIISIYRSFNRGVRVQTTVAI